MIFLFIFVMGTLIIGMGAFVYIQIKRTDPVSIKKLELENTECTQDFLPFKEISDSLIDMGNHKYRMIVECSSINYQLKTENEKEIIELGFQRFLNSLQHPITIFIQTRQIDYKSIIKNYDEDTIKTITEYPQLVEYSENFRSYLIDENINSNNKQKKKYIIIPFDDASDLTTATEEEKKTYVLDEIFKRYQIIVDNLQSLGISLKFLNSKEIVELFFSIHNKGSEELSDQISSGNYTSMLVSGFNKIEDLSDDAKLDWILYEAEERLKSELVDKNTTYPQLKEVSNKLIKELEKRRKETISDLIKDIEKMRNENAGYFKD